MKKHTVSSALAAGCVGGMIVILSGLALSVFCFGLFLTGFFLPVWSLAWLFLRNWFEDRDFVLLASAAMVVVGCVPWFLLRKLAGDSLLIFDLVTVGGLCLLLWKHRYRSEFFTSLRGFLNRHDMPVLGFALPLLFGCIWLGYAVDQGPVVRFYGLMFNDFGNLTSVTNLLKASPGLPLESVEDGGPLRYHWFYYALPALFSSFLGGGMKSSHALVLCNLLMAALLYKGLALVIGRLLPAEAPNRQRWQALGAGLILFAPSVMYFYQAATRLVNVSWFSYGSRNHLLQTLTNSMTLFGNNTFALLLCLLVFVCLWHWNQSGRKVWAITAAFTAAVVAGYSITLCFSVGLAGILALALGLLKRPVRLMMIGGMVGAVMFLIFWRMQLFSGGNGRLALKFDGGQFVQNVFCSFVVIWLGAAIVLWKQPPMLAKLLLLGAVGCLVTPTFLLRVGAGTGHVDFSMKTSSLIIAVAGPVALLGFHRIASRQPRQRWLLLGFGVLFAGGLLNTAAYALQFPYYRLLAPEKRSVSFPADYFAALDHVRRVSAPGEILLDTVGLESEVANPAVMIAERRVLLASRYEEILNIGNALAAGRKAEWRRWQMSGFADTEPGRQFASQADYLVLTGILKHEDWREAAAFGDVHVYQSLRRQ